MDLALYYAPTACSLIPYVTLTEAGARFETRPIDLRAGDTMKPDYLALNPMHKVPVLVVDGEPLTENVAIQLWIARAFPEAGLLPRDPLAETKAVAFMAWCASSIHPHLSRINSPPKFCAAPGSEASTRAIAVDMVAEAFAIAERKLANQDYFFERFTAPDAYFFWCWRRATQFDLPLAAFPRCAAHFQRIGERASVRKVVAFEKDVQAAFARAA